MAEVVDFPDAVKLAVQFLRAVPRLSGVQVGTRRPDPLPARFLLVRRIGGPAETLVTDRPMLTVEAFALDGTDGTAGGIIAADLLKVARAALAAADGVFFGVVEVSGPADLPDPNLGELGYTRYTITIMARTRGTVTTE